MTWRITSSLAPCASRRILQVDFQCGRTDSSAVRPGNLIARSADLATALDRALRLKQIEAVLPGIYARTHHKTFPEVRVQALQLYEPKAILVEHAAARLSFWPMRWTRSRRRCRGSWRRIRAIASYGARSRHLVQEIDGVRMTKAALTAIDLGADAIDLALRTSAATLDEMREALDAIRWQPGNAARRLVLQESSDEPWSTAERRFHRLLRAAGIGGWRGNVKASGTATPSTSCSRRAAGDRDRRARLPRRRQLRARPLASERDRPGRLASVALHLDHDRQVPRASDRDRPGCPRSAPRPTTTGS